MTIAEALLVIGRASAEPASVPISVQYAGAVLAIVSLAVGIMVTFITLVIFIHTNRTLARSALRRNAELKAETQKAIEKIRADHRLDIMRVEEKIAQSREAASKHEEEQAKVLSAIWAEVGFIKGKLSREPGGGG